MLNRKPRAALRCCTLAFLCFSGRLVTEVLSAPLPQDSTRPGDTIGRFVVSFDEHNKQAIKQHLLREGYNIVSDGGGFFAITHRGSVKESFTAAAVTRAAAPATAGLGDSREAAAAQVLSKSSSKGRRLLQRKQQQEAAEHLLALQRVPGIGSSEQDLPRFLHMRLSGKQGSSSTTGSRSTSSTAAAAEAATRRDRHSAASASRAGAGQAAAALAAAHLTGHWHSSGSLRPARYDLWGNSIGDQQCANNDTRLSDAAGAEILPWGVKAIGAANETLLKAQPQGRAIVCIIDSGLERDHPEYKSFPGQLSGCQAGANCPFKWSNDIVGHGTHVAGTIGAARNGLGVIGVVSNGADIHVVRIWNDSGDVSQGQGPYATDLVLAYDNCLAHLIEQQKADKSAKMVINMSFGSPGPLTVERLWIARTAKRGDVLFVSSSGNNGSLLTPAGKPESEQQPPDPGQFMSYPASYDSPEMLSVANMNCDRTVDYTSQKNKAVDIAAPGVAILSSVPREYGAVRAHISTSRALPPQTEPVYSQPYSIGTAGRDAGNSVPNAGNSISRSSGTTRLPKPPVRSGVGYLPNGYREPRAVQGTNIGSSGMLRIAACDVTGEVRAKAYYRPPQQQQQQAVPLCAGVKGALCAVQLPGIIDWYHETCLAMLRCVKGGGKGLILWRNDTFASGPADDSDFFSPPAAYDTPEYLLGTQVDCGARCACWAELRKQLGCTGGDCSSKMPPGIVVSATHAQALARANATKPELRVNITTYEYNYRHYDGTSMAAPHVAGGAALLWRLFPTCKAADISQAIKQSAQKLPDESQLAAGAGLLRVDLAFDWIKKNKACAQQ